MEDSEALTRYERNTTLDVVYLFPGTDVAID